MCKNIRVIQVFDNFPMGTKFKEILPVAFFGKETKELQRNSTKKTFHFQVVSFVRHKMGFKTK